MTSLHLVTARAWSITTFSQIQQDPRTSSIKKFTHDVPQAPLNFNNFQQDNINEGSLEAKLATIWTDGKAEVGGVREKSAK
jgi:hypothetical protein